MGKGDKPRPVNKLKYDKNFDRIFSEKKDGKKQKQNKGDSDGKEEENRNQTRGN